MVGKTASKRLECSMIYIFLYQATAMTVFFIILLSEEDDRTEILKSGLDLAMQYRNQAKTEVSH